MTRAHSPTPGARGPATGQAKAPAPGARAGVSGKAPRRGRRHRLTGQAGPAVAALRRRPAHERRTELKTEPRPGRYAAYGTRHRTTTALRNNREPRRVPRPAAAARLRAYGPSRKPRGPPPHRSVNDLNGAVKAL